MCGIVGYAGFTREISLNSAIEKINHRGPDDRGTRYFNGVALGNTRLAILDLSKKGHQPMFNYDNSLCIVFNGEIYNFLEVKKTLEKKYPFKSNSDTEVILYAYQKWGVKCLKKLNGMFAFVIYDLKKKLLFGARDRLGQKPLRYYFENGKFIFASEIGAIFPLIESRPSIDEVAIDNYLTFQYIPSPKTGFKKIYKLPPAHYFVYKDNKLSIHRYWLLDFHRKLEFSEDDWRDLIFRQLQKSVKSHLISDVPVGALLSGGLDSSIVVAIMSQYSSRKINTFSIGFDDKTFDESYYAKKVSQIYNTNHTKLQVTSKDLMENIADIMDFYDEPIGDNSILPTMLVSKLARKSVKVALTGDGGDENFVGYDRYTIVSLSNFLSQLPPIIKKSFSFSSDYIYKLNRTKLTERVYRFLSTLDQKFYRKYVNYNCFFTNEVKQNLYSDAFKKIVRNHDTYQHYFAFYDPKLSELENALNIDINTYLPDDLLYKTDIASMRYGLELRSPFLDHVLMEKMAAMPIKMKIKLLNKKKILKDIAISYNLLPKEIVYKRKQGFNLPQNKWFKGTLKKYLTNQILSSGMSETIFDKRKIENYLREYFRANLNYDNNIFALLVLSIWFDKYFDRI